MDDVGSLMAEEKVNIPQMAFGRLAAALVDLMRNVQGGSAIGVLNLDNVTSESALQRVPQKEPFNFTEQPVHDHWTLKIGWCIPLKGIGLAEQIYNIGE